MHAYQWWQGFDNRLNPPWEPPTILEYIPTPAKCVNSQKFIAFIEEVEVGESRGNIRRVRDGAAKEMIIGVGNGRFTWIDGVVETGVPRGIEGHPGHKIQPTNRRISRCRRSFYITAPIEYRGRESENLVVRSSTIVELTLRVTLWSVVG